MRPRLLLLLFAATCAAQGEPPAPAPDAAPPPAVQTFAAANLTADATALAVDDAGHVFLSGAAPSPARPAPENFKDPKVLREEDAAIFSLRDRREALARWEKNGLLPPRPPEATESVHYLLDVEGDGRADQRILVAGDFHDALDGPPGGLLTLPDGGLLFGCTPSLWRLEDDNHDLRSDRRLPLLTGFGIRCGDGLPGLRALTEGPDGFIYFTTSARGSRVTSAEGERFVLEGAGGVWRCLPDGTALELLARGLHEPSGIAVDLRGRIFVTDVLPDGASSRLVRVLPGVDFSEKNPGLEIGILPARVSGFIIEPNLSPAPGALPSLLVADGRSTGALLPVTLREENGALHCSAGPALWQGAAATGLASAPDGSVLWIERIPRSENVRSVLRLPPREGPGAWREGAALLSAGIGSLGSADLAPLLENAHPLVRRRAVRALAKLGFQESLDFFTRTARRSPSLPARLDSLWGIAALARSMPMLLNEVQLLTGSSEPDIRALAVHLIGETAGDMPVQELLPLLRDPSRDVREEVAIALGRLRPAGIAEEVFTAIQQCGDSDPALRQALVFALARILPPAEIAARGKGTASPPVQSAALAALTLLRAAETADFLDGENPAIVIAAARAIYDQRILPGFPALSAALEKCAAQPALQQPEFVHRALAAALRTGTAEAAATVAAFAADGKLPAELIKAARETLETWDLPPDRDPVLGRCDPPLPRAKGIARAHLEKMKAEPVHTGGKPDPAALAAAFNNGELDESRRIEALQQLAGLQSAKALEAARSLLPSHGTPALRIAARAVIMRHDAASSYALLNEVLISGTPAEMQAALVQAQRFDSKQSDAFWLALGKKLLEDKVPPVVELEIWEAILFRDAAPRGPFRRFLETARVTLEDPAHPLARWRFCETGGDPVKGRRLYESGRLLNCTACHSLQGRGGASGPELDNVASRLNPSQLLASLVQPSAAIAPGCGHVTVTLQDGASVAGILRKRDDTTLLLATPHGHRRINADSVQSLSTPVSPMPPASTLLTLREIRDLLAWLVTLK